jgi:DNA-binding MarR family transcriptional regulator|uniref:MarR family transcriptional regulator n=1 Tax=Candidatus Caldatribacterium californiense TaxID=1454726 RepID=A0A7V3YEW9_9BACT
MNEDTILKRLFLIQRLHFHVLHRELEKHGLHPGQPPVIMIVARHEGITQNQVAEKLNLRPATVAIMLRRMEKAGLVHRKQDESDRRLQRVYLTEKGKSYYEFVSQKMERMEGIATQGFSEEEKFKLRNFLDRIITNFKSHTRGDSDA